MGEAATQLPPLCQVPVQATKLIGRSQELERVSNALLHQDCRLLSILGGAGVGKTRLAVAVCQAVAEQFADGVCFVDLTQIADSADVPSLLATRLDIQLVDRATHERLKYYLADREMLLVLDNFEHVLPGALTVAEILEACPGVTVLATSREPLRIRWEQRMPLAPLDIPELDQQASRDELRANPSVTLFLQRARAVNMRLEMSDELLREVADICARLEGVPLAIELAAARTNILTPAAMLARFDMVVSSLQQHAPDVPERHQSMQAALDWSYRLLPAAEQAAFRRLGVFAGGWTPEAFEAVVAGDVESRDPLGILASLAESGLVTSEPTPEGEPRFRLLDTVRSFALEHLRQANELESVAKRFARYYLSVAEHETPDLRFGGPLVFSPSAAASSDNGQAPMPWYRAIDRELANLRAALEWERERGDHSTLMRLAVALRRYWWLRGHLREGTRWLELALERNADAETALRSRMLSGLGIMNRQQGHLERAQAMLEQAVALTRTLDDTQLLAAQLIDLGNVRALLGQVPEGIALIEDSLRLSQAGADVWGVAAALAMLGTGASLLGQHEDAETRLANALTTFRDLGDLRSAAIAEAMLARAIGLRGDVSRALPYADDALELCRQLGEDAINGLAVDAAAYLLSTTQAPEACARLLGAGDGFRMRGLRRTPFEQAIYDEGLATVSTRLDGERLAAALQAGRKLSAEQAIDEARALIREARPDSSRSPTGARQAAGGPLSRRELEVMRLLAEGCVNKEIGRRLGISENTAKFHVTSILNKLGVNSRVEAVAEAMRRGLL